MKRQWQIHRQTVPYPDGQRRWDRAYQLLLEWENQAQPGNPQPQMKQEKHHDSASGSIRTGVDAQPGTGTND